MESPTAQERLIVALDFDTAKQAHKLIKKLDDTVVFYKIGWQLFIGEGMQFVQDLLKQNKKVFLDLKIGDIEATVRAVLAGLQKTSPRLSEGVELVTIHGNGPTVRAAIQGRNGSQKPKLLMITALSSQDDVDIRDILVNSEITREDYVLEKARICLDAGCDGLIASGNSVSQLKQEFNDRDQDFIIVTPGIRSNDAPHHDHKYTLTAEEAIAAGSDYLVVGRPITQSDDPLGSAEGIIASIEKALASKGNMPSNNLGAQLHGGREEQFGTLLPAAVSTK